MTDVPPSGRHRRVEPAQIPVTTPAARRPTPPALLLWTAVVTAALCLPAAAGLGWLWVDVDHHRGVDTARQQALRAAESAAPLILSYDYRSIQADVRKAEAVSTGPFKTQYADAAHQLLTDAKKVRVIVQAVVGTAGVEHATSDRVVVLLFVDQASVKQLPGQSSPTTRIDQSRVTMTMSHVDGKWLVSELAAL